MSSLTDGARSGTNDETTEVAAEPANWRKASRTARKPWARAYSAMVRRIRRRCITGLALTVASASAEAFGLASLGVAAAAAGHTTRQALVICFAIAGSLAIAVSARAAAEWQLAKAQVNLERELRGDITNAILRCEWQDFVNEPGHELQSAALSEAPQVSQATLTFVRGCAQACAGVVVFSSAFFVSPVAAGMCAAFGLPVVYFHRRSSRALSGVQDRLAKGNQEITRQTMILVNGLRTLRLSPVQDRWREGVDKIFDKHADARTEDLTIPLRGRLLVDLLVSGMILSVLIAQQLLTGKLLPGLIVMALILRVMPRLQNAQQQLAFAENGASWIHRWDLRLETLNSNVRSTTNARRRLEPDDRVLLLESVTFAYRGHERPVLHDLDLELTAGEWVSLRGPSGQGKSTLVDVIGGILVPQTGRVLFAGSDLASYEGSELYRRLAIVPQDIYLVGTSVRDILSWGEHSPPDSDLDEVATALGINHMFSYGGDRAAHVDELSRDISGGMRTRLAMARALIGQPDLLLLDETTSRLHPQAEAEVFAAVRRLRPRLAVLVVTHRGETTPQVDRHLVLRHGKLEDE